MKKATVFEGALVISSLFLLFIVFLMVTQGRPSATAQWSRTAEEPAYFIVPGDDGLYTFQDSGVSYYDVSGERRWTFTVSPRWKILMDGTIYIWVDNQPGQMDMETRPIYALENGTLYIYAIENATWPIADGLSTAPSWAFVGINNESELVRAYDKKIIAISPDGHELWNYTVREGLDPFVSDDLKARGGLVYFYHGRNETVLEGGRALFTLNNVSDPASVDEQGNLYAVEASANPLSTIRFDSRGFITSTDPFGEGIPAGSVPSGIVASFYPNGTPRWTKDIGREVYRQYYNMRIRGRYDSLPLYHNGTLLVPVKNGIIALGTDGSEAWHKTFGDANVGLFEAMPVDENGSIYLRQFTGRPSYYSYDTLHYPFNGGGNSSIYILSPDGKNISPAISFDYNDNPVSVGDGILYTSRQAEGPSTPTSGKLMTNVVSAYDLRSGALLWSYRIPINGVHTAMIDRSDLNLTTNRHFGPQYRIVLDPSPEIFRSPEEIANYTGTTYGSFAIVFPAGGRAYVRFGSVSHPPWHNSSKTYSYRYSDGVYALDRNGSLVWYKSPDSPVTAMAANNTTFIYGTKDGGLSAYTANVAVGLTVAAAFFYVLIRFFLVGAVSRARNRLGKNENRNRVLEYVKAHPGSTLADVARGLKINFGTVRYHVLVLELNRRIVSMRADDRFVRYFGNPAVYSKDDRVVISMLQRDGIRKVLGVLANKPRLTNAQLSRELRVSESAVSKSMKALVASGIVVKEPVDGKAAAYSLSGEYKETISAAIGRIRASESVAD